jgi:hypothetical protein
MVDLPQHAAQISIWLHLHDPNWPEFRLFELNLRTPYLGVYALARGFSSLVGVVPALKFVVWLSIVGHWAAFDWLVRSLGHARWLGLLGLPLGMGYGFYWGFVSFIGALPFGLCAICLALRHREQPSLASGLWLSAALCATLATHGFALGLTMVLVAPLLLRGGGSLILRGAPLFTPALLILVWLIPGSSARSIGPTVWEPRFWELSQVPGLLLASSGLDHPASALGLAFLGIVLWSLGRPSHEPERFLPLLVMLLGYCLFPISLGGFTPLHPRFVAFLVPSLLLAFQPRTGARSPYFKGLIALTTAAWFCLFAVRLRLFSLETQPITDFIARAPRGLHIRPLIFSRSSSAFPGLPSMLHLSAYYVPEKGGFQGYSFAMYPTSVVRYRPDITPTMDGGAEWHPEEFSAAEFSGYNCFLVHSRVDLAVQLFKAQVDQVALVFHEQGWWAYAWR